MVNHKVDYPNNKLAQVENLLSENKYNEGEKLLLTIDELELESEVKIQYLFLKAKILLKNNAFKELFTLSKDLKLLCLEKENNEHKLESIIYGATALWRMGKIEESVKELEDIKDSEFFYRQMNKSLLSKYFHISGTIYWSYAKFDLALENLLISLQMREKIGNQADIANTLNGIGLVYLSLGNLKNALNHFKKSLKIKRRLNDTNSLAKSLNNIGTTYVRMGKIDKAVKFSLESLRIREEIGNQFEIARSNNALGILYYEKGELDQALNFYQKGLNIFLKLETHQDIAYALNNIGMVHFEKGNLINASKHLEESLIFFKKLGNKQDIAGILENLGLINRLKGNLSLSLSNFEESLNYRQKIGNQSEIANSLENIGYNKNLLGKYSEAIEHFEESLALREKAANPMYTALTLFNLIAFYYNYLENNNLEKSIVEEAKKKKESYFEELKRLYTKHTNKQIKTKYQLASCLKIIHNNERNTYGQAKKVLSLIVKDESNTYYNRVLATINLCYIYFYEYIEKDQKKDLNEIKTLIDNVLKFAHIQQITHTKLLFQVLKAKLAIFEHQLDDVLEVLENTKTQSEELGYKIIQSQCEREIERIQERNLLDFVLNNLQEEKEKQAYNREIFNFLKDLALKIQQPKISDEKT